MLNKNFVHILNYFKINKATHKNNSRRYSPQQNEKAVLTTAVCFKIFTPQGSQKQKNISHLGAAENTAMIFVEKKI